MACQPLAITPSPSASKKAEAHRFRLHQRTTRSAGDGGRARIGRPSEERRRSSASASAVEWRRAGHGRSPCG